MIPANLVARFAADLAHLDGGASGTLGLAVSGGPDSLAMLLLAAAARPGRIAAATVDHQLRPEAAAEAGLVADICAQLGVPHAILDDVAAIATTGLRSTHERARAIRYGLLGRWADGAGVRWIATAHHLDDQAETLLMRAGRGAGVGGLSGIRPINGRVIRPLLGWRRAELAAIVAAAGLEPVDDPSNRDSRFDRSRVRALLAANPALDPERLARSADNCAEADAALAWAAQRLWDERVIRRGTCVNVDPRGVPREIARRLVQAAIAEVQGAAGLPPLARSDRIDTLLKRLESGAGGTLGGVLVTIGGRQGASWHFRPAPPRRTG